MRVEHRFRDGAGNEVDPEQVALSIDVDGIPPHYIVTMTSVVMQRLDDGVWLTFWHRVVEH